MSKLPIRIRRHNLLVAKIARLKAAREAAIKTIVRVETSLPKFERELARRERGVPERAVADDLVASMREPVVQPLSPAVLAEAKATADEPDIPDFLVRQAAPPPALVDPAERKREKSRVRIEKLKAKQRGDTKRMPLQGKAAIEAIRAR